MKTSLHSFCRDFNLPKSSVHRRCVELNINTSDGLSAEDVEILKQEFDVKGSQINGLQTASIQASIDVGNHNIVLSTPTLPKTYTIESLRTSDAISFDDPLALAQEFLQTADLLTQEMQRDIRQREKRLQQTITAKEQITAKTNEFKLEARLYRERAWMLDNAQTQETQNLQDSLTTLQRLGKPQDN